MPDPGQQLLIAGDWHQNLDAAQHAIGAAAENNATHVIQLGDFGLWQTDDGFAFLDGVNAACADANVTVLWIDGNHEDFTYLDGFPVDDMTGLRPIREHVAYIPRGSRWVWNSVTFAGLGGAVSVDKPARVAGRDWFVEETISLRQANELVDGGLVDVLFTHDAPAQVPIPGLATSAHLWPADMLAQAQAHRELLDGVVEQVAPVHVFHGHYHSRYQLNTIFCPPVLTSVNGLGDDSSGDDNWVCVNLTDLAQDVAARRHPDMFNMPAIT